MKIKKHYFLYFIFTYIYSGQAQGSFVEIGLLAGIRQAGNHIGVSVADFDRDGWDDVLVTNRNGANRLYRNLGNKQFEDVAPSLGLEHFGDSECALWLDINNDGWQDLFLGQYESNCRLYLNHSGKQFIDITHISGIQNTGNVRACLANDVDLDGDLDIYVTNLGKENALFINKGALQFENHIASSGATDSRLSMGATFFDYDQDGDSDLYLIHDANQEFILYENNGKGHFNNIAAQTNANFKSQGMGVSAGDVNGDGKMDLYITNLYDNALLICQPDGSFRDEAKTAGVNDAGMGWGSVLLDFDNDGWMDIHVCNDYYFSPYRNLLYRNQGNMKFTDVANGTSLASQQGSYGTAWLDVDRNGLQDLFVANFGSDGNRLYLNQNNTPGNWVSFEFDLFNHNRFGVGTRVVLEAGGKQLVQELTAGSGYASQNPSRLHFGLGNRDRIDRVIFHFPGGDQLEWSSLAANQRYVVTEDQVITKTITYERQVAVQFFTNQDQSALMYASEHPLVSVKLMDVYGKIIEEIESWQPGEWKPVSHGLSKGVYCLQYKINGRKAAAKIIINN